MAAGEALRGACRQPRSWPVVRGWLFDLADEIVAAGEDGTGVPLTPGRVWVTDARATLLDWDTDPGGGAPPSPTVARFLDDVATIGLGRGVAPVEGTPPPEALPLHAQAFLTELAAGRVGTADETVERLRALSTRRVTVTRARRGLHLFSCAAAPLFSVAAFLLFRGVLLPLLARSPDAAAAEQARALASSDRLGWLPMLRVALGVDRGVGAGRPRVVARRPWRRRVPAPRPRRRRPGRASRDQGAWHQPCRHRLDPGAGVGRALRVTAPAGAFAVEPGGCRRWSCSRCSSPEGCSRSSIRDAGSRTASPERRWCPDEMGREAWNGGCVHTKNLTIAVMALLFAAPAFAADRKIIVPPGTKPGGNYSQGILIEGTLYISGQAGEDAAGKIPADFGAEVKQALENIGAVLKAADMAPTDVVSVQVYLTDAARFPR